jgi:DNA-binding SARP family transcriptional activator/CheY-like chemotaxis protein
MIAGQTLQIATTSCYTFATLKVTGKITAHSVHSAPENTLVIVFDPEQLYTALEPWLTVKGYIVTLVRRAKDIKTSLETCPSHTPTLMLVALPQGATPLDVPAVCRRALAIDPDIAILLLEDNSPLPVRVAALEAGALACVRTPLQHDALIALLKQHANRVWRVKQLRRANQHPTQASNYPASATHQHQFSGYLLGSEHLLEQKQELRLGASRALPLIAYLHEQATEVPRAVLVELLWREDEAAAANSSFRTMLTRLRQHVPDLLTITRSSVRLNTGVVYWDTDQFRDLAQAQNTAALKRASMLYRGSFLEDSTFEGSEAWELWLEHTRNKWQDAHNEVMRGIVDHYLEQYQPEGALRYIERWLALEPWQERAHRQLMFVHWRSKQFESAVQAFRRCQTVLAEELGSEPDAYTRALYKRINEDMHKQTLS